MTNLKARLLALHDKHIARKNVALEAVDTVSVPPVLKLVDTSAEDTEVDDDLPLYTATYKEISFWHASGCNGFLQDLLRQYDLDYGSPNVAAYNHFQIGMDTKRHVATFAIAIDRGNNKAQYYVIHFDKYNAAPLDDDEARRVLEKVSELRRQRSYRKEFCGYMLEYFHGDDD